MHKSLFISLAGAALLLSAAGCASTRQSSPGVLGPAREIDDDNEVAMTLDQVPEAVRATILEHTSAGAITELVADNEGGATVYDVEVAGGSEFSVSPSGEYLGAEADDEDADGEDDD